MIKVESWKAQYIQWVEDGHKCGEAEISHGRLDTLWTTKKEEVSKYSEGFIEFAEAINQALKEQVNEKV